MYSYSQVFCVSFLIVQYIRQSYLIAFRYIRSSFAFHVMNAGVYKLSSKRDGVYDGQNTLYLNDASIYNIKQWVLFW